MKKVLLISCEGLGNGGVQHVMMDIVRHLSTDFHFDILLFTEEERYFDKEFKRYGSIFRLPHYNGSSWLRSRLDYFIRFKRLYRGVKKVLQQNGPYDVIHCHNYFEAAPCLLAATHCGVPVRISHGHNVYPRRNLLTEFYYFLYRVIINRYATTKIACSQIAADYLFGKDKGSALPNAIDLHRFDIKRYSLDKKRHSFIHIGRMCQQKNQLFVLEVFSKIQAKWPDAILTFIGNKNAEYEKKLQQLIKRLHLNNIYFLPHDTDIPSVLAQSEYMIFPSLFEGFALAVAEAQAMGVKCFVSEKIPPEADIGLCQHLTLQQSAEVWAEAVFNENKGQPFSCPNTEKLSLEYYLLQIRRIYG